MSVEAPLKPKKQSSSFISNPGDNVFVIITVIFALIVISLVIIFAVNLLTGSWDSIIKNGISYYTTIEWSVTNDTYIFGSLNFIYASIVTSVIALIIGGAISIGSAIFLAEYAPPWLRTPIAFMIELLAAIPSIIYGFWGVQILSPILGGQDGVERFLSKVLGFLPMFGDKVTNTFGKDVNVSFSGRDIFCAGLILSIMIIPIVTSIARDVLRTVPDSQREGMLAMGATRWQAITKAVLPYGKGGIIGALILGLGRAIGETVAVAYLIGGASSFIGPNSSIFYSSETLPAKISNSYGEITKNTQSAIIQLGFTLFVITLVVNMIARAMVGSQVMRRPSTNQNAVSKVFGQIGKWFGFFFFPIAIMVLSIYLSLAVSLIIVGIWAIIKALRFLEVRAATQGKPFPRPLALIGNPNKSYGFRKNSDKLMTVLISIASIIAIIPLASILILVTVKGLPIVFQDGFLSGNQRVPPYGIGHAILGTLIMTGLGAVIGIPVGILAGIYLSEFGRGRFANLVRYTADVLQGIPSIIMGIVVYTIVVQARWFSDPSLTSPYNGIAASIALGIMIIPIITRNTEEILKLVPNNIREAALALGIPRWQAVVTVIIPAAFSGVMTGIILGVARIAGETAPLLLTARGNSYLPDSLSQQYPAVTLYIFLQQNANKPEEIDRLWGAAFMLVLMIMILTLGVRYLTRNKLGTRLSN
jgi:phosphate transport system permease protein